MTKLDISLYQGTVTRTVNFAGVGLHTGKMVELSIHSAKANTGIQFLRTDIALARPILAHPDHVVSTNLCTTLGNEQYSIATIEHLMAAFSGLGIDNALVCVNSCELPILDGSSAPFVDKLDDLGVQIQASKRKIIVPKKAIEVRQNDQWIRVEPPRRPEWESIYSETSLDFLCSIDFPNSKAIGEQRIETEFSRRSFLDLSEARTFCHIDDVSMMRANGLARGGSLDNAIVVNHEQVMNNDGLRYSDEFVRHKLLDCIGDLALLGGRLVGHVRLHKAGHELHVQLAKKLLENTGSSLVTPVDERIRANAIEGLGLAAMAKSFS